MQEDQDKTLEDVRVINNLELPIALTTASMTTNLSSSTEQIVIETIIATNGTISKKQQRKQKNREKRRINYKKRKMEKKQAHKGKREREASETEKKSIYESESEEEGEEEANEDNEESRKLEKIQNSRNLTMNRKQFKANKQQRMRQVLNEGPENNVSVIVDCSFNNMMTPREIVSMSQQLMFCYSLNSRIETKKPFFLSFTSLEGTLREATMKVSGFSNWIANHSEQHFTEQFSDMYKANKIIYLSADAEEELTHLEQGTMYVLGGLVDRNRHKNLCHKRAMELRIRQAKLPIGQYLHLKQAPVLTVNQCFNLLATAYENGGNWKEAVEKVVPQRKRKVDTSITESNEQSQESHLDKQTIC